MENKNEGKQEYFKNVSPSKLKEKVIMNWCAEDYVCTGDEVLRGRP